jgi:hypothetical protein
MNPREVFAALAPPPRLLDLDLYHV